MSLLPPNATPFERALESAIARASAINLPIRYLWRPDDCPAELLPWLAWAVSIDTWDAGWPESVKRERIRRAIAIQRRKGTAASVRDVVRSFGGTVALREWWQMSPQGDPHTFSLILNLTSQDGAPTSAAFVDQVIAEVSRTKPARSHFTFTQGLDAAGQIGLIGVARPVTYARLALDAPAQA